MKYSFVIAKLSVISICISFLSLTSLSLKAEELTNSEKADAIFRQFDLGEIDYPEQSDKMLAELDRLIADDDLKRRHKLVGLRCWYQDSATTEEINVAIEHASKLILLYSDPKPSYILTELLMCRGFYYNLNSFTDKALVDYNKAVDDSYKLESPRLIADARSLRGTMFSYQGEYSTALEDLITAQQIYESLDTPYWEIFNLTELATAYRRFGDPATALRYQEKLLASFTETDQNLDANEVRVQMGYSYEALGQFDKAIEHFKAAKLYWEANDDPEMAADMAVTIANAYMALGQYDKAKPLLENHKHIIPADFDAPYSHLMYALAQMAHHEGNSKQALAYLEESQQAFNKSANNRGLTDAQKLTSEVHASEQNWQQAYLELVEYNKTHAALDEKLLSDRNAEMLARFDNSKFKRENELLERAAKAREQQLAVMERNDTLQIVVIVLSVIILVILSIFAYKQLIRQRTYRQLALTDELTGLSNRRDTYNQGQLFLKQAKASGKPFSVISFDADHFKAVNDTLGHEVGDKVLIKLAEIASSMMRDTDVVGRVGGEEFLILLPNVEQGTAVEIANRLLSTIANFDWQQVAPELKQTVSAGVASFSNETTLSPLLLKADKALYKAKESGRNCVKAV
ncbi:tetratricopeptide repeat-containing diguanylate cyclase [Shewanella sp. WXL01]|uniref:diguanylate cyclase n=1 Tax=Shewanella sp. WXL01 TaxID=2709721 RepID=UPI00143838DA